MSFVRRIVRGAEYRSGLSSPESWLVDALMGPRSVSGQRVTVDSAFGLSPVFAAVAMISDAVGRMPLKVYREIADPADVEVERVEARQHRTWRMLHDAPNQHTPANRFWSTVTAHLLLWGNAFIEKHRSDGVLVDELYLLDPSKTTVSWDDRAKTKSFTQEAGNVVGASQPQRRTWSQDEVLHVFGLSLNGVTGVSRIQWCRNMFGNAQAREQFEGGFWDRGAAFSGVLERPDGAPELGEEGRKNLRASFKALYSGAAKKGFDIPVLEEGMTFRPGSMPLNDAQFVESQQLSRTDIAILFNLPPAYLGGSTGESLTYSTVEMNQLQFVQHAVMPWTDTIAKALIADPSIFPQNVFYPEFVVEALLRADAGARADFYTKMFAMIDNEGKRALAIDEMRARENLPPAVAEKKPEPPAPPPPPAGNGNGNATLTPEQIAALSQN